MKRKLLLVTLAFLLLTLLIGVVGCDGTNGGNGGNGGTGGTGGGGGIQIHTHNYVNGVCRVCGEKQNAEEVVSKLEYELSEDGTYYIVTGLGEEKGEKIIVPAVHNELPVKEIGDFAFCPSMEIEDPLDITLKIKQIILPEGLKKIGAGAFAWCIYLTEMVIPDSVETVGGYAFTACANLRSLTIGKNVKSIGDEGEEAEYDFQTCCKLVEIINKSSISTPRIPEMSEEYPSLPLNTKKQGRSDIVDKDGFKFYSNNGKHYLIGYDGDEKNITLPESYNGKEYEVFHAAFILSDIESVLFSDKVTSIGMMAFSGCDNLKNVAIGNGVTSIGEGAFLYCSKLTSITIGNSVTSIGEDAFEYCSGLTSITIGNSVTSIGYDAFYGCYKLVEVINKSQLNITKGSDSNGYVAYYALNVKTEGTSDIVNVNDYLFYTYDNVNYLLGYVGNDTELVLPDNYNGQNYEIYEYAFYNCRNLTSIIIPDSVTSIGSSAFYNCSKLTSVTIPDSVTSIGDYAFLNCSKLTSITIPNSVTSIGTSAFLNCSKLTSITIPNSVTSIGNYAFLNCSGLTSITIPDSVTSIGEEAFYGCYKLVEVINKSQLNITKCSYSNGYVAYYALNVKTEGTSDIVNVNDYLFYTYDNVNYLLGYVGNDTELVLPDNYNGQNYEIYKYAFYNCSELTSITIPDSVTSIGTSAFEDCSGLTSITIPDSVTSIGTSAFEDCSGLTSVTIPDSVTSIGSYAFEYCSKLTSITIPDSVTSIGNYAFLNCSGLKGVYISDIAAWCNIEFYGSDSNPLEYAHNLYLNDILVTDLVIPNTVTTIKDYAFYGASCLQSITIPDSVTSIGDYAFWDCSNLQYNEYDNAYYLGNNNNPYVVLVKAKNTSITSCTINDRSKFIHRTAFSGCSGLTSITIPDSVTSIGSSAFSGCSSLESITLPFIGNRAGVTKNDTYQYPFGYIFGTSSYTGGTETEQYYYGNSTSSTTSSYYYIPTSLKTVTITGGNILYGAFYNCSELTSITIPDSVTSIGNYAFLNCSGLKGVYISDIAAWCNIEFDGSYSNPLEYAHNLYLNDILVTDLVIPNTVTTIKRYAFYGASCLQSITIPDSVTSIGYSAFEYCSKLTSITIGNSVTSIGEDAFWDCSGLTSVTIGNSVTSIGYYAFYGCSSLKKVYFTGTAEEWKNVQIGGNNSSLTSATVYYYSAEAPTAVGSYWHYDSTGKIVEW